MTQADSTSSLRRVGKNSSWLLAGQMVSAVAMLAQVILITRTLGIAAYGKYALVTTFVLALMQVFDCRIWEALIKYVSLFRAKGKIRQAAATIQLCVGIEFLSGAAAMIAIWALADVASWSFFGASDHQHSFQICLYSLLAIVNIPHEPITALLRVADFFKFQAGYRVVVSLVRLVASAIACFVLPSVTSLLVADLVARLISSLVLIVMGAIVVRGLRFPLWSMSVPLSLRKRYREILRFVFLSSVAGNTRMITSKADTLVLGIVGTPAAVAIYDLAKKAVDGLHSLTTPLSMAAFPETSQKIADLRFEEARMLHRELSRLVTFVVAPFCMIATCLAPYFIPVVFGAKYQGSVLLVQILLWQLLSLTMVWFPGYLLAIGKATTQTKLVCVDAINFLLLLLLLVPLWGATGAAVAAVVRVILWLLMAMIVLRRLRVRRSQEKKPSDPSLKQPSMEICP